MIENQLAKVWYAPTRRRRYFSKSAAIKGEATAVILQKYPIEPYEYDTGAGFDIRHDEPERFKKMHRRVCKIIAKAM